MRTLVFSAVALLCLGFMSVTPSAAAPGAWQCMSPAFACGDAPTFKRHRAKGYAADTERRRDRSQKRSRKHVAKHKVSKPTAEHAAKPAAPSKQAESKQEAKPAANNAAAKVEMPERKQAALGEQKPATKKAAAAPAEGNYRVRSSQSGIASYYWQPQRVASGGYFNPNAMTAAHRTLPFGTKVRVTNKRNGKSVIVTINDRGPFIRGRVIDLSKAAAGVIGMQGAGLAPVLVERLGG